MNDSVLRTLVLNAFEGTPVPQASEITDKDWDIDLERDEIRSAFAGKAWHELPAHVFTQHRQALFFLSPRAWAYYVPAYMLAVIDGRGGSDTALTELAGTLMPTDDAEIESLRTARLAALTPEQRHAMMQFIEWAASEHSDDIDDDDRARIITAIKGEGEIQL